MAQEIERKFLVIGEDWRNGAESTVIRQGYLCTDKERSVRIRIAGSEAFHTVKGSMPGLARPEFEYPIPLADADELLGMCQKPLIEKTRYLVMHETWGWIVDVFEGDNSGLVVAEVELETETDDVPLPVWAGEEVTDDPRYQNANLIQNPYRLWAVVE